MEKEGSMFERSEFSSLPIFCLAAKGTPFRGQRRLGRLSLSTFFGDQRKYFGRRAETRLVSTKGNRFNQSTAMQRTPLERQPGSLQPALERRI
ncbi:hypothetical protein ACO0LD_12185 [Undibacterium sp. Ji83W]|uniref:hypothetical protein n=1 Tax=Undibacterium sp. Ji83W TaxID=3413043 RepID=UPI003BF25877